MGDQPGDVLGHPEHAEPLRRVDDGGLGEPDLGVSHSYSLRGVVADLLEHGLVLGLGTFAGVEARNAGCSPTIFWRSRSFCFPSSCAAISYSEYAWSSTARFELSGRSANRASRAAADVPLRSKGMSSRRCRRWSSSSPPRPWR